MKKKKLIIILVLFMVLTSIFSIVTYAKYVSINHTNGTNAIAKWEVNVNNQSDKDVDIIAGISEDTFTIKVSSNSEVAATYSIELTNVPSDTRVKLDAQTEYKEPDSNGKITFSNVGVINTQDNTEKTHLLTFKALESENEYTDRKIGVNVLFVQKEFD